MEISTQIGTVASKPEVQRSTTDIPAIIAPGPWIAFSTLAFGWVFDQFHLIRLIPHVPVWLRANIGIVLVALGLWCVYRANIIFHRADTPFQPWRPTRTIAANDIYGRTRNPMYQGFLVLVLGLAVLLRSDGAAMLLIPAGLLIHYGVVLREESYLLQRFGDNYRKYMAAVPRYGWPFSLLRTR